MIAKENLEMKIADMHCDTISELWDRKGGGKSSKPAEISPYTDSLRANNLHIDLQKMKQAGYTLQNFAMYINLKKDLDPFAYVLALIDLFDALEAAGFSQSEIEKIAYKNVLNVYKELL